MPTATSDYARQVLYWPDGEAIDRTDDNNAQMFQQLREMNMFFSGAMPNIAGDPSSPGDVPAPDSFGEQAVLGVGIGDGVYAPSPGSSYVYASGVANQLIFTYGPIMTLPQEPWNGAVEELALFRMAGGLTLTTAVGDAANPRIDLVEIKLEYVDGDPQTRHFEDATTRAPSSQALTDKERKVQITYQIKQGTPAASPAYPGTTAGFMAMAAVWIPATHNAVHSPANIRDLRMPFGVRAVDVDFTQFQRTGITPWVDLGGAILTTQAATIDTDYVYAVCPVATRSARLLGVGIHCSPGDDWNAALVQMSYPLSSAGPTATLIGFVSDVGVGAADGFTYADAIQIADQAGNGVPTFAKGSRAPGTRIGTPVWCNGTTGGLANQGGSPNGGAEVATKLALRFGCEGSGVSGPGGRASFVRFWIAEGL